MKFVRVPRLSVPIPRTYQPANHPFPTRSATPSARRRDSRPAAATFRRRTRRACRLPSRPRRRPRLPRRRAASSRADRTERKGRELGAGGERIEHRRRGATRRQQSGGHDRVDERDGRQADPELLGDEHQVDQIGSVTTARFREAHGDRPGPDQGGPEPRVEAQGLGGTNPCRRALLLEQRRERVPERFLLERQREVLAAKRVHGHSQNGTLKSQRYVRKLRRTRWKPRSCRRSRPTPTSTSRTTSGSSASTRVCATGRPGGSRANQEGGWSLVVDDSPIGWADLSADEARAEGAGAHRGGGSRRAPRDDAHRRHQRRDHLSRRSVLYAWNVADPAVGRASCVVYNDWMRRAARRRARASSWRR